MNRIEDDLRRALRVDPVPEGLTERIMRHVDNAHVAGPSGGARRARLAFAAMILLACGLWAGLKVRDYREGERVKNELMVGLRVMGASIRQVEERALAPLEALSERADETQTEE